MSKLYVGNISWGTTREELYDVFGRFGEVTDAFIPTDRETGRARGFAFVTMASPEGATAAVNGLNETELGGRTIRVNEAQPQGERGGGGGGGRGYGGGRGGGGYGGGGGGYGGGGGGGW